MKTSILITLLISLFIHSAKSQGPGSLDNSFGVNGVAAGTLVPGFLQFGDVAIQPDGKIIVMSRFDNGNDNNVVIMRVDSNGTLDNTFGTGGEEHIVTNSVSEFPVAMALQPDGKIVIGGGADGTAYVGRLNADGTMDTDFGVNGWTYTTLPNATGGNVYGLKILSDGKILAGGNANINFGIYGDVFRLNTDGKLDSTFGVNGHTSIQGLTTFCMNTLSNGKILIGGRFSYCSLVQLTEEGKIDSTFGVNGIREINVNDELSWFIKLLPLPDGKIISAGAAYTDNLLVIQYVAARFNSNGELDNTYATDGFTVTDFSNYYHIVPTGAALQSDNKVIMIGQVIINNGDASNFMLLRLNDDGSLDDNFGTDGVSTTAFGSSGYGYPFAVTLQPDGKIVVGGRVNNDGADVLAPIRYLSGLNTGLLDFSSNSNATMIYPNPIADETMLTYQLVSNEKINIRVMDATGRIIQSILNNENQNKGNHEIEIAFDKEISSGIYFLVISNNTSSKSIRVIKQ